MAILQGARITGSIIATTFIKANGFSGSITASNLYVLGKAGIGTTSPSAKLQILQTAASYPFAKFTDNIFGPGAYLSAFTTSGGNVLGFAGLECNLSNTTNRRLWVGVDSPYGVDEGFVGTPDNIPISFYTTGSIRMTISSAGNVGIGTTSPTQLLEVAGTLKTTSTITNDGGIYYGGGSNLDINQYNNGYMRFLTNNNEKMRIAADGNVGIGTTNPIAKFHVSYGTDAQSVKMIGAGGSTNGNFIYSLASDWSDSFGLNVFATAHVNTARTNTLVRIHSNETSIGGLPLRVTAQGSIASPTYEALSVNYLGNVGIGTTSPNVKLYVSAGTLGLNQRAMFINADITTNTSVYTHTLNLIDAATDANPTSLALGLYSHVVFRNRPVSAGSVGGILDIYTRGVLTDPTVKMTVTDVGNVGIGTTSPTSKLDVTGGNIELDPNQFISFNNAGTVPKIGYRTSGPQAGLDLYDNAGLLTISLGNQAVGIGDYAGGIALPIKGLAVSGNVGIGTSSPVSLLTVGSTTTTTSSMTLQGEYQSSIFNNTNIFGFRHGGADRWRLTTNQNSAASNDFDFKINSLDSAATNYTTFVTIKGLTGNVGIGTTSPANKLHISGSSTNLPLKLEGLTSNATGYFLTVDNTTGVVHKSTSGASGTSGTSGANGSPGGAGSSGTNGTSGTSGANGNPGTSGTSGANGNAGSSGITGTSGTSGVTNIKAWIHFNGTGTPSSNASNNVSSITDNGTGDYTINFTTAFSDANYVVAGTATYQYENPGQSINNMFIAVPRRPTAQLAGSCRISTPGSDNVLYDCDYVRVLFSN